MVQGNFCARDRRVVPRLPPGATQPIAAAEHSISRLCGVAAAMAERRQVAEAERLLASDSGRCAGIAGLPNRSPPAATAEFDRRLRTDPHRSRTDARPQRLE